MSSRPSAQSGTSKNPDVWVVIPLYNEAQVIGKVIDELHAKFENVVCVDDGSTDGSGAIAAAHGARVVTHPINLGQGAALQTGITFARVRPETQYVVTFDADGQHRIEDALAMLQLARTEHLGCVFGSRFLDDRTQPGFLKKVVLKTAVVVTNFSTHMKLTDAHNGLRVLSVDTCQKINMLQDRMAHASEIVAQIGKAHVTWKEYPVEVLYTDYSKAKGQSLLNAVNILFELIVK